MNVVWKIKKGINIILIVYSFASGHLKSIIA
jgi:hypothetical protein